MQGSGQISFLRPFRLKKLNAVNKKLIKKKKPIIISTPTVPRQKTLLTPSLCLIFFVTLLATPDF